MFVLLANLAHADGAAFHDSPDVDHWLPLDGAFPSADYSNFDNIRNQLLSNTTDGNSPGTVTCDLDFPGGDGLRKKLNDPHTLVSLKRLLHDDQGRVVPKTQLELAEWLIFNGFTIEARQILSLASNASKRFKLLENMSLVMDDIPIDAADFFLNEIQCNSSAQFWTFLNSNHHDSVLDPFVVASEFVELPEPIKSLAGFRVFKRLTESSHSLLAGIIERDVRRFSKADDPVVILIEVMNSLTSAEDPNDVIGRIVKNFHLDVEFLADVLLDQLIAAERVQPEIAATAGLLFQQYRSTELGSKVHRGHILALAKSGQFREALQETGVLNDSKTVKKGVRNIVLGELAKHGSNLVFLEEILSLAETDMKELDGKTRANVGKRLTRLGFPEATTNLFTVNTDTSSSPLESAVFADAIVSQGGVIDEDFYLKRNATEQDIRIAIRSHISSGDFSAALDLARLHDQSDLIEDVLWRVPFESLDIPEITSPYQSLVRLHSQEANPSDIDDLNSFQNLADQSSSLREEFTNLLSQ